MISLDPAFRLTEVYCWVVAHEISDNNIKTFIHMFCVLSSNKLGLHYLPFTKLISN